MPRSQLPWVGVGLCFCLCCTEPSPDASRVFEGKPSRKQVPYQGMWAAFRLRAAQRLTRPQLPRSPCPGSLPPFPDFLGHQVVSRVSQFTERTQEEGLVLSKAADGSGPKKRVKGEKHKLVKVAGGLVTIPPLDFSSFVMPGSLSLFLGQSHQSQGL